MLRSLAKVAFIGLAVTGCTSTDTADTASSRSTNSTTPTVDRSSTRTAFTVDSLGLSFVLPGGYRVADDSDYLFLARSGAPLSVFSVGDEGPDVADHEPEEGETLAEIDLGAVDGVIVINAVLDGLPPGISANELLVSNGARSFSVIMSATGEDLPAWEAFIDSVAVAPDSRDQDTQVTPGSQRVTSAPDAVTTVPTSIAMPIATSMPRSPATESSTTALTTVVPTPPSTSVPTYVYPTEELDRALHAAGFDPSTPATRRNIEDACRFFTARDVSQINGVLSGSPELADLLRAAFGIICPENVGLVGVVLMPNGDPVFPGYPAPCGSRHDRRPSRCCTARRDR